MDDRDEFRFFRSLPLFESLDDSVLEKLTHVAQEVRYETNEAVFEEGDEGDSLCFIVEGSVVVQKRLEGESERFRDLAVCEAGDIIGEMALFDNKPRAATVRARTPLIMLQIYRRDFETFLDQDSVSATAMLGGLISMQSSRMREALRQLVTVFELVHIVASAQEMQTLATQVAERLKGVIVQANAIAFCLWSPYHEACEVLHLAGAASDDASALSVALDGPVADMLRAHADPFDITPLADDHPIGRLFAVGPRDHIMLAPLRHGEALLGYILLVGRAAPFTAMQRLLVGAVAAPVASAIVNARYAQDEVSRGRLAAARAQSSVPRGYSRPR